MKMCNTWYNASSMETSMIQIRNVPVSVHRKLKSRAALAGMSLSDYLLVEIRRIADLPTVDEMLERMATRTPVSTTLSPAEALREERDRP
jgi:plasmid stability protein